MNNRISVSQELKSYLQEQSNVIAAWEGGSAATGFVDEYSDLDLTIISQDQTSEEVLKQISRFLKEHYGIIRQYRLPEPTWHGASQIFCQIKDSAPYFYLDICVIQKSNPQKLMESDRHGRAVIWFEKEPIYDPSPTSEDVFLNRGKNLYRVATQADFVTIIEIHKAIERKLFLEAFPLFYSFVARNFAILLNLKYRPSKVDFGLRYASREFSTSDCLLLENALKVTSLEEISQQLKKVEQRFEELKKELKDKWN